MNAPKIPRTDSIHELAEFCDTHDLTDFAEEMEEVAVPIFQRPTAIGVLLQPQEAEAVARIAQSAGIDAGNLIRQWVLERIHAPG
jgi:hypothetical protein